MSGDVFLGKACLGTPSLSKGLFLDLSIAVLGLTLKVEHLKK